MTFRLFNMFYLPKTVSDLRVMSNGFQDLVESWVYYLNLHIRNNLEQ